VTFELNDDAEALRKVVRDFADTHVAPHAADWDRDHAFPLDTVRAMGDLGLFGIPFPEAYGGGGGNLTLLCVAIEELARVDQSVAITLEAGVGLGANPIYRFGTDEQKERWLPDLVAGRALAGFGLTEPDAGSDAGASRSKAALVDGSWVINGEKHYISGAGSPRCKILITMVRTSPDACQPSMVLSPWFPRKASLAFPRPSRVQGSKQASAKLRSRGETLLEPISSGLN
jgi:butyryl-CoA dehydrogenase